MTGFLLKTFTTTINLFDVSTGKRKGKLSALMSREHLIRLYVPFTLDNAIKYPNKSKHLDKLSNSSNESIFTLNLTQLFLIQHLLSLWLDLKY